MNASNKESLARRLFEMRPCSVWCTSVPGQRQGITVLESWAFGSSYPTAGDPSIGFIALSIGALFVLISLLAIFAGGTQRCITVTAGVCAVVSSLALFVKSFGELAGIPRWKQLSVDSFLRVAVLPQGWGFGLLCIKYDTAVF